MDRVPPLTRDAVATKRALLNRWLGQIPNDSTPSDGWIAAWVPGSRAAVVVLRQF
jgi:hypothetical protein